MVSATHAKSHNGLTFCCKILQTFVALCCHTILGNLVIPPINAAFCKGRYLYQCPDFQNWTKILKWPTGASFNCFSNKKDLSLALQQNQKGILGEIFVRMVNITTPLLVHCVQECKITFKNYPSISLQDIAKWCFAMCMNAKNWWNNWLSNLEKDETDQTTMC